MLISCHKLVMQASALASVGDLNESKNVHCHQTSSWFSTLIKSRGITVAILHFKALAHHMVKAAHFDFD